MTNEDETTYCGYIAIVGRPNVGKSTLLNRLIGSKVSITAGTPQTTRQQVLAVKTEGNRQTIFVDTPGIHRGSKTHLNKEMNKAAWSTFTDVDIVVLVVDRTKWTEEEDDIAAKLKTLSIPVLVVVNKMDHLDDKASLLPVLAELAEKLDAQAYYPLSAKTGQGIEALEQDIDQRLPAGPHMFGAEDKTNRQQTFQMAELVREKLIRYLGDELPHVTSVQIESINDDEKIVEISALIWVERESQKRIIIGKHGDSLKRIGIEARRDLEVLLNKKVMLKTWVKVKKDWRDDRTFLKTAGFVDE